jgi:hypothetical protein
MRDLPDIEEWEPGPWYRVLKGRHGLIIDPEPFDGPPCLVCGEPSGNHRTGWFHWTDDDGRLMAGPACFAEIDRLIDGG